MAKVFNLTKREVYDPSEGEVGNKAIKYFFLEPKPIEIVFIHQIFIATFAHRDKSIFKNVNVFENFEGLWRQKLLSSLFLDSNLVEDKPDLLVLQYFPLPSFIDGNYTSYAYTNCRIYSSKSQASQFDLSVSPPNGLDYDSRSKTVYRGVRSGDVSQFKIRLFIGFDFLNK